MHSAKCSADRRMLERGLLLLAARKVAKMTKDPMKKSDEGLLRAGIVFLCGRGMGRRSQIRVYSDTG